MSSTLIPTTLCISSNETVKKDISACFHDDETLLFASEAEDFDKISLNTASILIIDFSDWHLGFTILDKLAADPWLHYQNIITIYNNRRGSRQLSGSKLINFLTAISRYDISDELPVVLNVIRLNRPLISDRAIPLNFDFGTTGSFRISNSFLEVEVIVSLVTSLLYNTGKISWQKKNSLNTSLIELIINSIEHGNCEIGYAEKRELLRQGYSIQRIIEKRLQYSEFRNRKVTFSYNISTDGSLFNIMDEGPGFDWEKYTRHTDSIDYTGENGRGIMIALSSLDSVKFNEAGNAVTCMINHRETEANQIPAIFHSCPQKKIPRGEILIHENDESNTLYFIKRGRFSVSVNHTRISTITPDNIFAGEMALLISGKRTATVQAETDSEVIPINKLDFIINLNRFPHYSFFIAKLLAQKLNNSNYFISKIMQQAKQDVQ
ncbi:MAG: cyclic nucleotide-binding domain-containing protein [Fibrobacterota bacterium]